MKLNVAAALTQSTRRARGAFVISICLASWLVFSASAATALDGIDLSGPSKAKEAGGCSQLVQIKYPFLGCTEGEIKSPNAYATWENSRRIPIMSVWTESDGHWGPDQNGE